MTRDRGRPPGAGESAQTFCTSVGKCVLFRHSGSRDRFRHAPRATLDGGLTAPSTPTGTPLIELVGVELAPWFMWMLDVELEDGELVHAYKHIATRRYLHLGEDGRARSSTADGTISRCALRQGDPRGVRRVGVDVSPAPSDRVAHAALLRATGRRAAQLASARTSDGLMQTIAIDWSGRERGAAEAIWFARVRDGVLVELENGMGRGEVIDTAIAAARREPQDRRRPRLRVRVSRVVLRAARMDHGRAIWDAMRDDAETLLEACEPPFWGRPGRLAPRHSVRGCARPRLGAPATPKSVFQIGGSGAVGTGSLRGMRHLVRPRGRGARDLALRRPGRCRWRSRSTRAALSPGAGGQEPPSRPARVPRATLSRPGRGHARTRRRLRGRVRRRGVGARDGAPRARSLAALPPVPPGSPPEARGRHLDAAGERGHAVPSIERWSRPWMRRLAPGPPGRASSSSTTTSRSRSRAGRGTGSRGAATSRRCPSTSRTPTTSWPRSTAPRWSSRCANAPTSTPSGSTGCPTCASS